MKFRFATTMDFKLITDLHFKAFKGFFLSSLGVSFMQTYYRTAISHPDSICVCSINDDGEICGFVLGPLVSKGFHKRIILANKLAYCLAGIKIAVTRPNALIRLKNNLDKINPSSNDDGMYAEIALIGVSPASQGKGIGRQLFMEFEKEAKKHGVKKICLTTDHDNNDGVVAAYNAWGFKEWYSYISYPNSKRD